MKKLIFLLVPVVAALLITCSSKPAAQQIPDSPPWINESAPEDVIWGIGLAKQSDRAMSMTTAEARARVSIARQLDARVRAMFTDYNRDAGTTAAQANVSLQENVSRTLTQVNLSGASVDRTWVASDGTFWVRVSYSKTAARNMLSNVFDSEAARYAEFKADEALRMMDSQLAALNQQAPTVVSD